MLNREVDELIDRAGGPGFVMRALNVHRTTLMRWRTGKVTVPKAALDLLRGLAGTKLPWADKSWTGWHFDGKYLRGDEGECFEAWEMKAHWITIQMVPILQRENAKLRAMVESLAKGVKSIDTAANDLTAWEADPRAIKAPREPAVAPRPGLHKPEPEVRRTPYRRGSWSR